MAVQVVNFGSLNIDLVYSVDEIVRPGQTLPTRSLQRFPGGKGANQTVALARAGLSVAHVGNIGTDGGWLLELIQSEGVDTRFINRQEWLSGHAIIQIDQAGQNAILVCPGANGLLTPQQVRDALDATPEDAVILLQNETSAIDAILRESTLRGRRICWNPAPMTNDVAAFSLEGLSMLVVNETEGATLTGEDEPEKIAICLCQRYPKLRVVLTLGARGVMSALGEERIIVAAPKMSVVDTTAAGDCFIGYYLAASIEGLSERDCLERACRAAALSVTRAGAIPSIPRRAEI